MKLTNALNARRSASLTETTRKFLADTNSSKCSPTIFHQPWWLENACDGAYHEAIVSSGGTIAARLPYCVSKSSLGLTTIGMPLMTHVLGPAFARTGPKGTLPNHSKQISMVHELLAQLPPASHVSLRLHRGFDNTLAFDSAGFCNSAGFTVEINPSSPDVLWRQMRDKTRNVLRRAEECLTVSDSLDPDEFLNFYEANLHENGRCNFYDRRISANLIKESLNRGVGRIVSNRDKRGDLQSAIFTVWDEHTEYYFMSTRVSTSMNGATSLNIWSAIQHAASKGLTFDMDGIHIKGVRVPNLLLLTGFGGTMKPRYLVKRTSPVLTIAQIARDHLMRRPKT